MRDFIALGERGGTPGRLGTSLTRALANVFKTLNAPGRDRADLAALAADTQPARDPVSELLTKPGWLR